MNQDHSKAGLIILDGWGIGSDDLTVNAVAAANTPLIDQLMMSCPKSRIKTSGEDVGLPAGQMGNSEVGHMNIGAGRIVWQQLSKIDKAIRDRELASNTVLSHALARVRSNGKKLHLLGLVSDGGVHSSLEHLMALCKLIKEWDIPKAYIHAFTDGRDSDPHGAIGYLDTLQSAIEGSSIQMASIVGRYYAMDRDQRWERVKVAYDLLVHGTGNRHADYRTSIEKAYAEGITDEFMPATVLDPEGNIEEGDTVLFFNFRTDRGRQLTRALYVEDFEEQNMHKLDLHYITMTRYDATFHGVEVVFEDQNLNNTLGEVLSYSNRTQMRAAETEKYPHVTFFFSGGREQIFRGETRIMAASPKVATYDLQPEMSAQELTDKAVEQLQANSRPDFFVLNYANPDMVGHTGVFSAVVQAMEAVDRCLKQLVESATKNGYSLLIMADHGNAELMRNEDGSPNTAHTTHEVPLLYVGPNSGELEDGRLADIAPTLLHIMGVQQPKEMTGENLWKEKS